MTQNSNQTAAPFAQVFEAISNATRQIQVPEAARDFVKRTAVNAKERAVEAHDGATNATASVEKALISLVNGGAAVTRSLLQAGHENLVATLATVEKVAAAQSAQEAIQIQIDFARDNTRANVERIRDAAEFVRGKLTEGAEAVRADIAKVMPAMRKAA
jgi:hypothetical protein